MLNKIFLEGHLTGEVDCRATATDEKVSSFRIAGQHGYGARSETLFVNVKAFGKKALYCRQFLSKGSRVIVVGRLRPVEWTGKDGRTRREVEIIADEVEFLERERRDVRCEPNEDHAIPHADGGDFPF